MKRWVSYVLIVVLVAVVSFSTFLILSFLEKQNIIGTKQTEEDKNEEFILSISLTDVMTGAKEQGLTFCEELNKEQYEECYRYSIIYEAENKEDPMICNKLDDKILKRDCVDNVVFSAVLRKAKEDIIDTSLCEHLEEENQKLCEDPEELLKNCFRGSCYV
jgi:hypothetical protein